MDRYLKCLFVLVALFVLLPLACVQTQQFGRGEGTPIVELSPSLPAVSETAPAITVPATLTPSLPVPTRADMLTATSTTTATPTLTLTPTATLALDPLACLPEGGQVDYGIVVWVKDGNVLVVNIRGWFYSVRYLGVAASLPATKASKGLLLGQVVRLVRDGEDADQFGQLLRYVLLGERRFINYELVRHGLARYEASPAAACEAVLQEAEQLAMGQEIGLWAPAVETSVPLTRVITQPVSGAVTSTSTTGTMGATASATQTLGMTLSPTLTVTQTIEVSSTATISPTVSTTTTLTPSVSPTLTHTSTP